MKIRMMKIIKSSPATAAIGAMMTTGSTVAGGPVRNKKQIVTYIAYLTKRQFYLDIKRA